MNRILIIILAFLSSFKLAFGQELQEGYFLFVGNAPKNTHFEQSIVAVTQGKSEALGFSHVGIISIANGDTLVLESTPQAGVCLTPWKAFQAQNEGYPLYLGILKKQYLYLIPEALERAKTLLGKQYDYAFDLNNDNYYCSELIYKIFEGSTLQFPTPPMTFKKEGSEEFLPFWVDYYQKLNIPIPEGEAGLNPTGMSKSGYFSEIIRISF